VGGLTSIDVRGTASYTDVVPLARGECPIVIGHESLVGRHISVLTGVVALSGS
jgi:hypothetical protein